MKIKRVMCLVLAVLLMLMFVACSGAANPTTEAGTTKQTNQSAEVTDGQSKIYIGLIAARTGGNQATGELAFKGATLAVEQINAAGGILGKQIEFIVADEIDTVQSSVNACTSLLEDDRISAIVGSQYSQNILAAMPNILEKKVPFIAGGSNDAIAAQSNPYVWQPRNFDAQGAYVLAQYAHDTLNVKNPALIYSTLPNAQGPAEKVVAYYKENYGIEISKDMMFGYEETESNFATIVSQIQNSGADGLFHFGNQQPLILIMKTIYDAQLTIPMLANTSATSTVVLSNSGAASDNWYSTCDWAATIETEFGSAFQKAFFDKYAINTDTSSAYAYDSIYLIKAACENANSTDDREKINDALSEIKDLDLVLGTYNTQVDHGFLDSMMITQNKDGKVILVDKVKYR